MTDWTSTTCARELPDGTQVEHDGEVFTAFPAADIAGARIRWHSDTQLLTDRSMNGLLDDGAKVVGCSDESAVAEFRRLTG